MGLLEGILYMMWRGIAIGIIISAPMGPVGILCVQRTLEKGRAVGFFTGIGAAISDLFYCLITGFGLSFIEEFLKANQNTIQVIGSAVLVIFGIYLWKSNPTKSLKKPGEQRASKRKNILGGFLFTVSNPLIIFLIIGLFARFNFLLPEIKSYHYVIGFVFIFIGALIWWWLVTLFVDKVRSHFNLRSMWLVNKIISVIVMIFALVGFITAVTSPASAKTTTVYLNSTRGFGAADSPGRETGTVLRIENPGSDTVSMFLPLNRAKDFIFAFRLANVHNEANRKYKYLDRNGKSHTARHPGWEVLLKGHDGTEKGFSIRTEDNVHDSDQITALAVKTVGTVETGLNEIRKGVDFFGGENGYSFRKSGERVTLWGGHRSLDKMGEMSVEAAFEADSVGITVMPGGAVELDWISLETTDFGEDYELSHFGNREVRESYFARSEDPTEGEWAVFDLMLDGKVLKRGGDYRMALVRNDGERPGYDMIYVEGAEKNRDEWRPGRKKGRLEETAFKGVYDVIWYDPAGEALEGPVKAQLEDRDLITIQFSAHSASTVRLKRVQ